MTDQGGTPIAGATVQVQRPGAGAAGAPSIARSTTTDAGGQFVFEAPEDGVFPFAGVDEGKLRILAYVGGKQVTVGEVTAPAKDVVLRLPAE